MKLNVIMQCRECKTKIRFDNAHRKYCKDCAKKIHLQKVREWKQRKRDENRVTKICRFCSKVFVCRGNRKKYCSAKCSADHQTEMHYQKRIVHYLAKIQELKGGLYQK